MEKRQNEVHRVSYSYLYLVGNIRECLWGFINLRMFMKNLRYLSIYHCLIFTSFSEIKIKFCNISNAPQPAIPAPERGARRAVPRHRPTLVKTAELHRV